MNTNSSQPIEIHDASALTAFLRNHMGSENLVSTTLKTDERVIACVTDGIYRQPGSALRELNVNAYDADATKVVVKTDAPRFGRIPGELAVRKLCRAHGFIGYRSHRKDLPGEHDL
ncbi:MAG: hypothetical protein PHF56_11890 [Desulfuromonadaceae bacterium]|nr:hypothetical protein [Desulfuromonadaceae bacterium]